jgi:aromatic ring-cleaving dioxygenase
VIEAHRDTNEVEVHTLYPRAVGPHPTGNFEVLFTRRAFGTFVPWLMWNRCHTTPSPSLSYNARTHDTTRHDRHKHTHTDASTTLTVVSCRVRCGAGRPMWWAAS